MNYFISRLQFIIEQPSPLSVSIQSCGTQSIDHKLFFNQTSNTINPYFIFRKIIFYIFVFIYIALVPLRNSTATSISVPCAAVGRYDLLLVVQNKHSEKCLVTILVNRFNVHTNWSLLDHIEESPMRFYNRLQRRQMIVMWDRL